MGNHRNPSDDRPRHYGDYVGAIAVTGVFLFGAVVSLVVVLAYIISNWWILLLAIGAGAFMFSVFSDSYSERPVDDYENVMGMIR